MSQNLLQIIQDACRDTGVNETPQSAFQNSSEEVQRLVRAANKTGRALAQDHQWEALIREATFQSVATEDQGDINVIADGFGYILNDTMWDRTSGQRVAGPHGSQNWQAVHSLDSASWYISYRIRGGRLLFTPALTAGHTIAFEYVSRYWIQGAMQDRFMADTDVPVFDDELMILGVIWRFKQAEGFAHAEEFASYKERLDQLTCRDGGNRTVETAYARHDGRFHVQDGNWGIAV